MMNYNFFNSRILRSLFLGLIVCFASCETTDLDLRDSPNSLASGQGDTDFLLTSMEISLANFFSSANFFGSEVTRQRQLIGPTYSAAYSPQSFDGMWTNAYANVLIENKNIIESSIESELFTHAAIAQLASAYTLVTLVDYFGDVPYSESFNPEIANPALDSGEDVYAEALNLIDQAIDNLEKESLSEPTGDLFYDGDVDLWRKFANSLKLKIYLNLSLVDSTRPDAISKIDSLITDGNLISTASENFAFQYSSNDTDPDSRHPDYSDYIGDPTEYMSNYMMWVLAEERSVVDPRLRFYFYRQDSGLPTNTSDLSCLAQDAPSHYPNEMAFCTVGDSYYGRDHGRSEGVPPDSETRTVWGSYPVGGKFDDNSFEPVDEGDGLAGAGIAPILMNFTVDFWLAESALVNNTQGDPLSYLQNAVRKNLELVFSFVNENANSDFLPGDNAIDDYVSFVTDEYNSATSDEERLYVIAKEFWIATYGNGAEAYNLYRRTGMPNDLQPMLLSDPGDFYRSFLYPSDPVTLNSSISQKGSVAEQVFWDTNPADFID